MKRLALAVVGILVAIAYSGCASLSVAPPLAAAALAPAADGMPARGTRWRYKYQDEQFRGAEHVFTVEIVGVEGFEVKERMTVEGGEISETVVDGDQWRFRARTVSDSSSVVELAPYAPALYSRSAAQPSGYPAYEGAMWRVDRPTYAEERVTVPAGTFAVVRVEVKGRSQAFGFGTTAVGHVPTSFNYTAWYSPEIERYVKLRHQTWNRFGSPIGDEVVQLIEYQSAK